MSTDFIAAHAPASFAPTQSPAEAQSIVSSSSLPSIAELRAFVKAVARKERQNDNPLPNTASNATTPIDKQILPACNFITT